MPSRPPRSTCAEKMFEVVERALGLSRDSLYLEDEKVKCRARPDFELPLRDFVISGIQTPQGNFQRRPHSRQRHVHAGVHIGLERPGDQPGRPSQRALHRRGRRRTSWRSTSRPAGCAVLKAVAGGGCRQGDQSRAGERAGRRRDAARPGDGRSTRTSAST